MVEETDLKIISRELAKGYLMALAYKINKEDGTDFNVEEEAELFLSLAEDEDVFAVDENGEVYLGSYEFEPDEAEEDNEEDVSDNEKTVG